MSILTDSCVRAAEISDVFIIRRKNSPLSSVYLAQTGAHALFAFLFERVFKVSATKAFRSSSGQVPKQQPRGTTAAAAAAAAGRQRRRQQSEHFEQFERFERQPERQRLRLHAERRVHYVDEELSGESPGRTFFVFFPCRSTCFPLFFGTF